jgi:tripartite-type tricarboxylate transporter receptor subunit TctC
MQQINFNRRDVLRAAAAGLVVYGGAGHAQGAWPSKPVTMIVPFPAGGGTDAFARPMAAQFTKNAGKALVIDNRGGAGGTLGAGIAAKAAPDGYTLFMGAVHHTIAPSMYPKLEYDLERDLVPLIQVASVPQVLVVNAKKFGSTTVRPAAAPRTIWPASCSNCRAKPSSRTSPTEAQVRRSTT